MHPADIKARLEKRGVTYRMIAADIGVSVASVWKVLNRQAVSDRIFKAISARIGMDHEKVFSWYYRSKKKPCVQKCRTN
jgi:lambda repressor-like predicted transcriptional regulator